MNMARSPWRRTLGWVFVAAAIVAVAVFGVRVLKSENRASNERNASTTLKSLTSAEAEFRANDRDNNGVNDFWTGDVSGLYEWQLIPRELAEADAAPIKPLVPMPIPFKGYLYRALDRDLEVKEDYRQDTGGKPAMGKVHNTSKFGFIAYPVKYGETGKFSFMVNENNTIFRRAEDGTLVRDMPDQADLTGSRVRYDQAPPTPLRKIEDAVSELPRTTVTEMRSADRVHRDGASRCL